MTATVASRYQFLPPPEDYVGEVKANVNLQNVFDLERVAAGQMAVDAVRALDILMVVDTGANSLVLPEEVREQLGSRIIRHTSVEYADGRIDERPVAGPVQLEVLGRLSNFDFVVGPRGTVALLGQVVLEMLDLLVDCKNQRLVVNPQSPYQTRYAIRATSHSSRA